MRTIAPPCAAGRTGGLFRAAARRSRPGAGATSPCRTRKRRADCVDRDRCAGATRSARSTRSVATRMARCSAPTPMSTAFVEAIARGSSCDRPRCVRDRRRRRGAGGLRRAVRPRRRDRASSARNPAKAQSVARRTCGDAAAVDTPCWTRIRLRSCDADAAGQRQPARHGRPGAMPPSRAGRTCRS